MLKNIRLLFLLKRQNGFEMFIEKALKREFFLSFTNLVSELNLIIVISECPRTIFQKLT